MLFLSLTQNPAGVCRQCMQSWTVRGSSLGAIIGRRLEALAMVAGWPARLGGPARELQMRRMLFTMASFVG